MASSYKDDKNIYKNPLKLIKEAMRNTSIEYSASENVHVGGCQEFCVNGILNHSLTLSPKTKENWLMASPQLRIG